MTHRVGWECPVCHKGNAPFANRCEHCARADSPRAAPGWEILGPGGQKPQWPAASEWSPQPIIGPGCGPVPWFINGRGPHGQVQPHGTYR